MCCEVEAAEEQQTPARSEKGFGESGDEREARTLAASGAMTDSGCDGEQTRKWLSTLSTLGSLSSSKESDSSASHRSQASQS